MKTIIGVYILNNNRHKHYVGPFDQKEFDQWKIWMEKLLNPSPWTIEFDFIQIDRNVTDAFFSEDLNCLVNER